MRTVLRSLLVAALGLAVVGPAAPARADSPVDDLVQFLVLVNLPAGSQFVADSRECQVSALKPTHDPDPDAVSFSGRGVASCSNAIQSIYLHVRLYCYTGTSGPVACGDLGEDDDPSNATAVSPLQDGWSYTTLRTHAAATYTFAYDVTMVRHEGACKQRDSRHVDCYAVSVGTDKGV